MNEKLKKLAEMVAWVHNETFLSTMDDDLSDKAYLLLREAAVDAINLRQKILDAMVAERERAK